jgi:mono/diheme cytochrome c family protein
MRRIIILTAAVVLLAACAGQDAEVSQEALARDGREIAEAQCAACHAVGPYGESPAPEAPPFRYALARYDSEVLEEELIQGIRVAHPMPEFQFNPQGVDALIAYMQSIQQTPPPESN